MNLTELTIRGAHDAMLAGNFSPVELTKAFLDEANKKNSDLNTYLEIYDDSVEEAKVVEKRFKDGNASLLSGIPIALKDNILVEGKKASAGSKILTGFTSPYDSTVARRLKDSGAVFLGRTNMDEFAMGSSTENSAFGPSKNPFDTSRVPGGSSGGSAVAVASHCALVALGSDTGGSVRQPASFCGVVGLKPTYGSVSRHGLIALGSSLDQIGPFAKTVDDAEIVFNAIRGRDALDSTSVDKNMNTIPKVIGIPKDIFRTEGIHPDVLSNFDESKKKLSSLGFKIVEVELPNLSHALAVYYIVMPAEASSNLSRFDGVKYGFYREADNLLGDYFETRGGGFGKEPRRRIILGTYVLSSGYYDAYYGKANEVRRVLAKDFDEAFKKVDAIITPTTPTPAFKIGEKANDPLSMYLADIFTVPANIVGLPAISLPSGFSVAPDSGAHLPLGIQVIGRHFEESALFHIGKKFLGESV